MECGQYASLGALHKETVDNCPDCRTHANKVISTPTLEDDNPDSTVIKPTNPAVFQDWAAKYACQRASPLICANQELVNELKVIGRSRELEGEDINALAYEKAVAVCAHA